MNNLSNVHTMVTTLQLEDEIFIGATATPYLVVSFVVAYGVFCLAGGPNWLDSFND